MSQVQTQIRSYDEPALVAARADLLRELRGFLPEDSVLEQEEGQEEQEAAETDASASDTTA